MTSDFETACTCNLCWQLFGTGPSAPLVLPKCGDTFCRACLCQVQAKSAWQCPLCAYAYTEISVPDLPVNFLALVVTSVLKEKSSNEKIQLESKGSSDHFHRSLNRIREKLCSVIGRLESPKGFKFSAEQVSFSNDDTSGSGSSSASASALASVRIGETQSAADSVSLACSVRDEVTAAKAESSVSNILAHLPFSWLQIKESTVSNGQCNGSTQEKGSLSNGIMLASGLASLPPKADLRDRSQDPKPLGNNESNSPSKSLSNDTNANVDVNESLTTSTTTSESSGVDSLSSDVKESTQENSFDVSRISSLQIKDEVNYHQKVPSEEFGLTNASASASSASTSSSSLETSAPRSASTPGDSSSKTAAANYSLSVKPKDGSGNRFRPTPMDPKMAITTTFEKLNSEKGYYEEITSKGFLSRGPSACEEKDNLEKTRKMS